MIPTMMNNTFAPNPRHSGAASPGTPRRTSVRRGASHREMNRTVAGSHSCKRGGFTLIEVMVALAILMVMLVIMFVPINMGVNLTQIGRTRADVQQTSQLTLNRLEAELQQAMIVLPNDQIPGVSNKKPFYQLEQIEKIDDAFANSPTVGACTALSPTVITPASNTSRIDFILPARDPSTGTIKTPLEPSDYVITYYARRINIDAPYDPTSNPIELYRVETHIGETPDALTNPPPPGSLDCITSSADINKRSLWLYQSKYGEPNLDLKDFSRKEGAHTMVTPREMGLIAPLAGASLPAIPSATPPSYKPNTSFICIDSDGDGKIDRVKVSLTLAQYDSGGVSSSDQRIPLSTTITLPNVK